MHKIYYYTIDLFYKKVKFKYKNQAKLIARWRRKATGPYAWIAGLPGKAARLFCLRPCQRFEQLSLGKFQGWSKDLIRCQTLSIENPYPKGCRPVWYASLFILAQF
jgi:hypothetical protein